MSVIIVFETGQFTPPAPIVSGAKNLHFFFPLVPLFAEVASRFRRRRATEGDRLCGARAPSRPTGRSGPLVDPAPAGLGPEALRLARREAEAHHPEEHEQVVREYDGEPHNESRSGRGRCEGQDLHVVQGSPDLDPDVLRGVRARCGETRPRREALPQPLKGPPVGPPVLGALALPLA